MCKRLSLVTALAILSLIGVAAVYFTIDEIVRAGPGAVPSATPDAPTVMSYQGRLANPTTGQPVPNGNYNMHFAIYDAPTGGTRLWQEPTAPAVIPVAVRDGVFSILLGSLVPLTPPIIAGGSAYLEVNVNGETLQPRQRIASVAYAMVAQAAENASAIEGQSLADLSGRYVETVGDTMTGNLALPTLLVRNASAVNTVEISGSEAAVRIGTTGNEGNLRVSDNGGVTVLEFDGNLASMRLGGTGNEGDFQIYNDENELVIDLDAEEFAGSAGLRIFANDGTQAFSVNSGTGDVSQSLPGDGLVKAAVHVDRDGGNIVIDRWFNTVNGVAPVLSGSAGSYTLDMGFDVSQRFVACTIDPNFVDTRNANCSAGTHWFDPGSELVDVFTWDPDTANFTAAEFNLIVY